MGPELGQQRGLAWGPGEPLGMGGRYDDLLGQYDAPAPATAAASNTSIVSLCVPTGSMASSWPPVRATPPPRTGFRREIVNDSC